MTKLCKHCGAEYTVTNGRQLFCDDNCRDDYYAWQKQLDRERRSSMPRRSGLDDMALAAKRHGMSYGQYTARVRMEGARC